MPYESEAAAFRASEMSNRRQYADPVRFLPQGAVNRVGEDIYSSRPRAAATYQVDSEMEDDMKMKMDMADTLNLRAQAAAGRNAPQQIWQMPVTDDMFQYAKQQRQMKELAQKHAIVATMYDSRKPGSYDYIDKIDPEFHRGAEAQIAADADFAVRNHLVSYTGIRTPDDLNFVIQKNAGKFKGPVLAQPRNANEWYLPGPVSPWNFVKRAKEGNYNQHILATDPYWSGQYAGMAVNTPGQLATNRAEDVFGWQGMGRMVPSTQDQNLADHQAVLQAAGGGISGRHV